MAPTPASTSSLDLCRLQTFILVLPFSSSRACACGHSLMLNMEIAAIYCGFTTCQQLGLYLTFTSFDLHKQACEVRSQGLERCSTSSRSHSWKVLGARFKCRSTWLQDLCILHPQTDGGNPRALALRDSPGYSMHMCERTKEGELWTTQPLQKEPDVGMGPCACMEPPPQSSLTAVPSGSQTWPILSLIFLGNEQGQERAQGLWQ